MLKANLKKENGQTIINLNGKEYTPVLFRSFRPSAETAAQVFQAGVKFAIALPSSINTAIGRKTGEYYPYSQFGEVWSGEKKYNWANLKKQIDMLLHNAPSSHISLMIQLDTRDWFLKDNPEHLETFSNLLKMCMDEKWRKSASNFMLDMLDWLEENYPNKIFCAHICAGGTTEWCCGDREQSHPFLDQAFKLWKKDKEAQIPDYRETKNFDCGQFSHPIKSKRIVEYWRFSNEIVLDTILFFARQVKKHTNGKLLVATFYGRAFNHAISGISGSKVLLSKMLSEDSVDIICAPMRKRHLTSELSCLVDSINLHNKLFIHEIDVPTKAMDEEDNNVIFLRKTPASSIKHESIEQSKMILRAQTNLAMSKGAGYWWFDMLGGNYNHPSLLEEIKESGRIFDYLHKNNKNLEQVSEVAFIFDEESTHFHDHENDLLNDAVSEQALQLRQMGVPWDSYTSQDICNKDFPHDRYKLYIFPNIYKPEKNIKEKIRQLRSEGKSMLFIHAPGFISESDFSLEAMKDLTGFKFKHFRNSEKLRNIEFEKNNSINKTEKAITFGFRKIIDPLFTIEDSEAEIPAYYENTKKPAFALKNRNGAFDFWCGMAPLPANLLRETARKAGAFVYNESNAHFTINESLLGMYSPTQKIYDYKFPFSNGKLKDMYEGNEYIIANGASRIPYKKGEMKVFEIIKNK